MARGLELLAISLFLVELGHSQTVMPSTGPQYVTLAKCNFIVFGQFTYDQAKAACQTRQGDLAFFTSASEDHAVRKNINWNLQPGFQRGQFWIGQLWIGIQRQQASPTGWAWDNIIVPGVPVMFSAWVSGDQGTASSGANCVVAREDGWVPMSCNGNGTSSTTNFAGALCASASRNPPPDSIIANSNNYCNAFLLPPNPSNLALPVLIQKNYFLAQGSYTWDQAVAFCNTKQAQVSTSRSPEEFAFITKNINFASVNYKAWFGLKRAAPGSSNYNWIDGMPNSYTTPFLQGPYDYSNGDCVAYDKGSDGSTVGWKVYPCSTTMNVLCETFIIP